MPYQPIIRCVICPTVTPLKPDGDINLDMIAPLIDWLFEKGVAGIYPLGNTGEGPLFTTDERKAVAAATVEAVSRRVPNLDRPRHPHSACETDLAFDSAIALTIRNRTGSALRWRAPVPQPRRLPATVRRY